MLQRANPATRPQIDHELSSTPKPESAISTVSSPSPESESAEDQMYEAWLDNVRTIEFLREYIIDRLKRNDYEPDSPTSSDMEVDSPVRPPSQPAYPVLPLQQ